jgi:hypothetical protein
VTKLLSHEEAFELLPWFVNGTLSDAEHAGVDHHVRNCLPCRIALQEQAQLEKLLKQQPIVPLSAEPAFERLLDEIGAQRRRTQGSSRAWPTFSGVFSRHAVTAAVLFTSLGVASWLATLGRDALRDSEFVTLTGQTATDFELDIVFVDELSAAERSAIIGDIDGVVTEGPNDVGRYRVRIGRDRQDVEDALQRLQADGRVRFAGRAFGENAP